MRDMDNWKDLAEMAAFALAGIFFACSFVATAFLFVAGLRGTDLLVVLAGSLAALILCFVHVMDIHSKMKGK